MNTSNRFLSLTVDNDEACEELSPKVFLPAKNRTPQRGAPGMPRSIRGRGQQHKPTDPSAIDPRSQRTAYGSPAASNRANYGHAVRYGQVHPDPHGDEIVSRPSDPNTKAFHRTHPDPLSQKYSESAPRQRGSNPSRSHHRVQDKSELSRHADRLGASQNVFGEVTHNVHAKFPRVVPLNIPVNTEREGQRLLKEDLVQCASYLHQIPDDDELIALEGVFIWPPEDLEVETMKTDDPRLDEIRKRHFCHLVMASNPKRLRVFAMNSETAKDDVEKALEAIRTLFQESLLRASRCLRFIVAQPPRNLEWPSNIRIWPSQTADTASFHAAGVSCCKTSIAKAEAPIITHEDILLSPEQIIRKNTLALEMAIGKGLERLALSPGRVEVKALIGCFVFQRIANPPKGQESVPISTFLKKLRDTKSQGLLLRLSPEGGLFERALSQTELFTAYDHGKRCSLHAVKPTYVGVFTFGTQKAANSVHRQLSIETRPQCDESRTLSIVRRHWTSPYEHPSTRRLEAFVADLEGGLSWKLEAVSQPYCRNIEKQLLQFQSKVALDKVTAASDSPGTTELVFKIPATYGLGDFYQRTQWKFHTKVNEHWVFQITRLDRFNLTYSKSEVYADRSPELRQPVQTEWEACLFDERWDDIFGDNGALALGESAGWVPSLPKFFPSTSDGAGSSKNSFAEFVSCVNDVCRGLSLSEPW